VPPDELLLERALVLPLLEPLDFDDFDELAFDRDELEPVDLELPLDLLRLDPDLLDEPLRSPRERRRELLDDLSSEPPRERLRGDREELDCDAAAVRLRSREPDRPLPRSSSSSSSSSCSSSSCDSSSSFRSSDRKSVV